MFSFTLFKNSFKSNYKLILIFMAILTMYFTIIFNMYDPNNLGILDKLAELKLSPELLSAMGFNIIDTSLVGFIGSYFYGLLAIGLPMIFYIILSNKLIASQVEKGSMSYLLSTPNKRSKIVFTQAMFIIFSVTLLIILITVLGLIMQAKFPDLLDMKKFMLLNLGVLLLHYALSGISFLSSCTFNESKNSLLFGAGIPLLFLLVQMLSNIGEKLSYLKNFTLMTLYNTKDILSGNSVLISFSILAIFAVLVYTLGIYIFSKRDLSI